MSGKGTGDVVITANNGTDLINYTDMGMAGSLYNYYAPADTPFYPLDGYLLVQGEEGHQGGNLIIGTTASDTKINIMVGGNYTDNIVATFDSTGTTTFHGDLIPSEPNMFHLGSPDNPWHSLWLGTDSLYIGNSVVSQNPTTGTITFSNTTNIIIGNTSLAGTSNTANAAFNHANSSYNTANSAGVYANGAFAKANAPSYTANSAAIYANGAFTAANAASDQSVAFAIALG